MEVSELDELIIMEWNINQRANYAENKNIPSVVINKIKDINADIIVLTEFFKVENYKDFISDLEEEDYTVFLDPRKAGKNKNQILIAISNKIDISNGGQLKWLPNDINGTNPNFLQVEAKYNNQPLIIIGTRIRWHGSSNGKLTKQTFKKRKKEFEYLINHLKKLKETKSKNIMILGDFNNARIIGDENILYDETTIDELYKNVLQRSYNYHCLKREFHEIGFNTHTPKSGTSIGNFKIDHLIVSNHINLLRIDYDPNYDTVKSTDKNEAISEIAFPDHAILTASIKI
jgi:exonuclease III